MIARIVDKYRNVRTVPAPVALSARVDPTAVLSALLVRHEQAVPEGQLEFEVDDEFVQAMQSQASKDKATVYAAVDVPWKEGHRGSFQGVPLIEVDK